MHCADCSVQPFPIETAKAADVVAFYVPMHTATRLALNLLQTVKEENPAAHICFFGLYAPVNEPFLRRCGVDTILGGEFEQGLADLRKRLQTESKKQRNLAADGAVQPQPEPLISLDRQQFITPERDGLPPLAEYAQLFNGRKTSKPVGYTEATRGCKYHCRHCPVVPVYNGRFRVVQKAVVLADIRQQVAAGAEHITFGDPDFFNGPGHVLPIVTAMQAEFPGITYDVTIKIEHLLKYRLHLPALRDSGCILITSAVESIDDAVLRIFDKGHTREDFFTAVKLLDDAGLALNPTFVTFTPWTTLKNYRDLLNTLAELNLVENVSPIQLAIRLLIPHGSRLLELKEIQPFIGEFNAELLTYDWQNQNPLVEELYRRVTSLVSTENTDLDGRLKIFKNVWGLVNEMLGESQEFPGSRNRRSRAEIPYLNEPWYC